MGSNYPSALDRFHVEAADPDTGLGYPPRLNDVADAVNQIQALLGINGRSGIGRVGVLAQTQGLVSQNYDRQTAPTGVALVDQRTYAMLAPFVAGDVVTNLHVTVSTGGATLDFSKMGLYDTAGNRLAVSADQATAFQSTGTKTVPLTAPYTVPTTGALYVAVLVSHNAGSMPQMLASSGSGLNSAIGTGALPFATESTQTDLDATATFIASGGLAFWVGAS